MTVLCKKVMSFSKIWAIRSCALNHWSVNLLWRVIDGARKMPFHNYLIQQKIRLKNCAQWGLKLPKINYFRLCIVCNEQVKRYFTQIGSDLFDKAIVDESAKNNMKKPLGFTFNIKSFKKSFRQNLGQIFDSKNLKFRRKFTSWHLPISLSLSLSLSPPLTPFLRCFWM